jgi:hypothetical protein
MDVLRHTAWLIVLAGACFAPELDGRFACDADGGCPPGLACAEDRLCRAAASDAADGGRGAAVLGDGGLGRLDLGALPELGPRPGDLGVTAGDFGVAQPPPDLAAPRDMATPPDLTKLPDMTCVPRTCERRDCMPIPDGCGGMILCPDQCHDDEVCSSSGRCVKES